MLVPLSIIRSNRPVRPVPAEWTIDELWLNDPGQDDIHHFFHTATSACARAHWSQFWWELACSYSRMFLATNTQGRRATIKTSFSLARDFVSNCWNSALSLP